MSEIIETYQQEQEKLGKTELPQMAFATVVSVHNDGLELRFDGEPEASTKHFPCNTGVSFGAGQRVLMMKVNGSYVALCPVGLQGGGSGGFEVVKHSFSVGSLGSRALKYLHETISNPGKTPIGIVGVETNSDDNLLVGVHYINGFSAYFSVYNMSDVGLSNLMCYLYVLWT